MVLKVHIIVAISNVWEALVHRPAAVLQVPTLQITVQLVPSDKVVLVAVQVVLAAAAAAAGMAAAAATTAHLTLVVAAVVPVIFGQQLQQPTIQRVLW